MATDYEYAQRIAYDPNIQYPVIVHYCGECTLPLEYCEFSQHPDKCRAWLENNLPEEFERLYSDNSQSDQNQGSTKGRQVRGGKGTIKKPAKQQIQVFKTSRGKKKYTTSVTGLSTCGIDLKSAATLFGRKFATSSSVTGNGDEIIILGQVKDELVEFIMEKWSQIDEDMIEDLGEMKR